MNDALTIIARMINNEHDEHADLLARVKNRINDPEIIDRLSLVHKIRTEAFQDVYEEIKSKRRPSK